MSAIVPEKGVAVSNELTTEQQSALARAQELEARAAVLLNERQALIKEYGLPPGITKMFAPTRELGKCWNVEIPVFCEKNGVVMTLLFFGVNRPDNYNGTYFVPGTQQGVGQGPEDLLPGIGKKLGVELSAANCEELRTHWAPDDPVAPLLSVVYATSAQIPNEVPGAAWYSMDDLPSPIPPNHRRLIDIGLAAWQAKHQPNS